MSGLKKICRRVVVWLLKIEAKIVLKRYQPRLIGVTGSIGKTSAKDAIDAVLAGPEAGLRRRRVRASAKSFNSEIGVPLTILNRPNGWGRPGPWLKNLAVGFLLAGFGRDYPDWLILEIGADRPGDIKQFTRWLKLDLLVITNLPTVPAHLEFFASRAELVKEKLSLLGAVRNGGTVILNGDDRDLTAVKEKFSAALNKRSLKFVTYGFAGANDFRLHNDHLYYENERPSGLVFKIDYGHQTIPFRLNGLVGRHQLYAPAAALAVGATLKFNLVAMAESLHSYAPPPGRLRLLEGIKSATILDDSYNSSPAAVSAALAALKTIKIKGKKIAVLGDMLELGEKTVDAHRELGREAAAAAELVLTVGIRAKFIATAAAEAGLKQDQLKHFDEAREAGAALEHLIGPGDLILVKGSQSMRMERVVEEIMAEPDKKGDLLCRQEPEWLER